MRNAFHQAAITHKGIGVVVNNIEAVTVKLFGQNVLSDGHADRVGNALA